MTLNRPSWSSATKLTISLLLLFFFVYLLVRFSLVIRPLILAVILAYVLSPLVKILQNRLKIYRWLAILLSYILALILLTILPAIMYPIMRTELDTINLDIQRALDWIDSITARPVLVAGQLFDLGSWLDQLIAALQALIEPMIGQTLGLILEIISSLVWVIVIVVVSFYLIKDGERLRHWVEELIPPMYMGDFILLRDEINQIWAAFFRGQLVLGLVVGIIITIFSFTLGLPFALLMGVLAGLLEFLPSVGHAIWLTIASILAFFVGSTWLPLPNWAFMLLVIGLHLIFEQFDLNYLIPRIIGRRVHLPPLVVILGIVTGALLAGVLGILLAAPTIASARVLGRYVYANLFDLDPFPGSTVPSLPPPNPRWWKRSEKSTDKQSEAK
jgi:predicted PurR-regulated permease PerM